MEGKKRHGDGKVSWIEWYCTQPENIFFCQVNKTYIQDNFNLYDLKTNFSSETIYKEALTMILDEASIRKNSSATQSSRDNAQYLYGLIHARYIKCAAGLEAMRRKYVRGDFGTCPRHGCSDQLVLPIGMTELAGQESVKVFCTKCQNVYSCSHLTVDASFFGPTFPHLFFMTFLPLVGGGLSPEDVYVPKVFGFRVHASSTSLPSSKYYAQELSSSSGSAAAAAKASGNGFNIAKIKQHNSVIQHVEAAPPPHQVKTENRKKRRLEDSDDEKAGTGGGDAGPQAPRVVVKEEEGEEEEDDFIDHLVQQAQKRAKLEMTTES